jgi:5-bromo-4-chloroindolyl phosphate hydrolysis protein
MKKMESDGILAGVLGAAVFVVFFLVIDIGIVFSLLLGAAAFIGGFFLFERKKPADIDRENDLKQAIEIGDKNLLTIKSLEKRIRKGLVVSKVKEIDTIFESILLDIKKDPAKLHNSKQFLDYYVPSTIKILSKYIDISSQNVSSTSIKASLTKVEGMLDTIRDAFDAQHARILSNDVMDLDTEIKTLDQTINMDGLGKE